MSGWTNNEAPKLLPDAHSKNRDMLVFWDERRKKQYHVGATVLSAHLEDSLPTRRPKRYQGQRNHHGLYYFAQTGEHIWHESGLERAALQYLDFRHDVAAVAAQPCIVTFADGQYCYPDYFVLYADGRQQLLDVHERSKLTPENSLRYALLADFCKRAGLDYQLFTGISRTVRDNLNLLAAYRHLRFAPVEETQQRILQIATHGTTLTKLFGEIEQPKAITSAQVHHLLWNHHLITDLDIPVTATSLLICTESTPA